ncbi:hypothetical protein [Nostoc sp.]|uniref:hypothetical protein n=1 Tax=Nostoc sp. TaxID=1180 RepID=UPI002FF71E5D
MARIEEISVKNYRVLQNIILKDIKPFSIFLGPNGSGKREQREKVRSGFGSQLYPYILNKTWFFSCDAYGGLRLRILKQAVYVPGFSTSPNRVAPVARLLFLM